LVTLEISYQPYFYDWAFNAPDGPEGEIFLTKKWAMIPENVDLLLVHGPPRWYGDIAPDGRPTGSPSLIAKILELKPKLSVHGHIHCGRGQWTFPRGNAPDGYIVNASVLDEDYKLSNKPIVIEIE